METKVNILLKTGAQPPSYMTTGSAGADLYAYLDAPLTLLPHGGIASIPTGVSLELPTGLEAQIRPRSGLARKHGVTVLNAPGTIDSDYRGEISVWLMNHSASRSGGTDSPARDSSRTTSNAYRCGNSGTYRT